MTAALAGRLYLLQVVYAADYSQMAYTQRTVALAVDSGRGAIVDRNGVPLADPRVSWAAAAITPLVQDPAGTAAALAPVLGLPEGTLLTGLTGPQRGAWLKQGLTEEERQAVAALDLPGITVSRVTEPHGPDALARHLLGYFNDDGGQLGLERAFDAELRGAGPAAVVASLSGRNKPLAELGIRRPVPLGGKEPYSLNLTLDAGIQRAVEQALDAQAAALAQNPQAPGTPFKAAVVVLDPYSGEVLAMASRPDFDYPTLDRTIQVAGGDRLLNRAVTAYPPGSVFKPFVAAMALERDLVSLDDPFFCPGYYESGGIRFWDAVREGHGWLDFRQAIAHSCNATFLRVGEEYLGLDGLRETARLFGFGQSTDLVGNGRTMVEEQAGQVPATREEGVLQVAFGQGSLLVTPLQVARGYAAFVNGGVLPGVKLVRTVRNPAGEVMARPAAGRGVRVISPETAAQMREALLAVTDPEGEGTGKAAWIPGAGAGGKTGSAEAGGGRVHAWFAGFFPADRPQYVAAVLVEDGGYGGLVAAPLFRAVGEAVLAAAPATAGY